MTRRFLGLCAIVLAARVLAPGMAAQRQGAGITWDFETGDLLGWQPTGTAFAAQPTYGDNPRARGREPANPQGRYWIGTYERYQGPGRGQPGDVQGDRPQGTLTSIPFTIPRTLTFRIGGGSAFETRVELLVLDEIEGAIRAVYASGKNNETMQDVTWNLERWAGRQGRIRVVDASSGGWGHINVDDFRFDPPPAVSPIPPGIPPPERVPDQPAARRAIVPNLVGHTEEEALQLLEAARLAVGPITAVESDARPGTVVSQDRDPRSQVAPDTRVGFAVAVPRMVKVPRVVEREERDAVAILARSGLEAGRIQRQPSRAPRGQVLEQDPPPGQLVPIGSAVDLVVAASETAVVPPIVGRTQADAAARVESAGLVPGAVTFEESRNPEGTVLRQQPPAGQIVEAGTGVDMVVARPVTVSVPPLVGRAEADAIGLLRQAELVPGAVTSEESREPEGTVLSQRPQAGDIVAIGTAVRVVVASPVTVLVPSLAGRTRAEASELLGEVELVSGTVTSVESRRREGTVLSQDPASGRRVPVGTRVDFVLARPVTVRVPSLVGRTRSEAVGLLEKAELALGDVRTEEARRPPGTVLSQRPEAGATVVIGSAVAIVTATPVTTLVPDLASRSEDEARQRLAQVELATGTVTTEESRDPVGSVLRQSIAAGTRVAIGTRVDLTTAVPVTVLVPALVAGAENDARDRLAAVELAPGTIEYRESARPGTVLGQGIAPGTRVPVGTLVNLVVGVVETVLVPSVVGLSIEEARDALIGRRLAVGAEEPRPTHLQPEGTVLAQGVQGGTRTAVGTPVALTVATTEMVVVPPVVGLSHDGAAAAVAAAGLTLGAITPRLSVQAGGTVLAQTLQPNQQVPYGTSVALDEARPRIIWMAPAVVLLLAGLGGLLRIRKRGSRPVPSEDEAEVPPPPGVEVRVHADAGDAEVRSDEAPAVRLEVRIQPVVDRGSQEASETAGDFIRGERRERAPGATPPEEMP